MSPIRRDALGQPEVAATWERLAERLIQQAIDDGEFDDLPFQGERLPLEDDPAAGDRALAFRMLRNAGMAPPARAGARAPAPRAGPGRKDP